MIVRVPGVGRRIDGEAPWPSPEQWEQLRAADRLDQRRRPAASCWRFELPHLSMSLVELRPLR